MAYTEPSPIVSKTTPRKNESLGTAESPEFFSEVLSIAKFRDIYRTDISPRIEKVFKVSTCDWIPEDLYRLVMNTELLAVSFQNADRRMVGVAIICLDASSYVKGETNLYVSLLELDNIPGLLDHVAHTWDALAVQYNLKTVTFSTSRRGWGRRLAQLESTKGYELSGAVYLKEYGQKK